MTSSNLVTNEEVGRACKSLGIKPMDTRIGQSQCAGASKRSDQSFRGSTGGIEFSTKIDPARYRLLFPAGQHGSGIDVVQSNARLC